VRTFRLAGRDKANILKLKATKEEGWKIGSKATAYRILAEINPLLTLYAKCIRH